MTAAEQKAFTGERVHPLLTADKCTVQKHTVFHFIPDLDGLDENCLKFTEPPATVVRLVVSSWSGAVLPIFKNAHVAKISVHVEEQIYLLCCMLVFHYLLCIP